MPHYVVIRDDDTCALTPAACLEQLYRPFLERSLPVALGVIPDVATDARRADGQRELFLQFNKGTTTPRVPIGQNRELVQFLRDHPLFEIVHHGYDHSLYEFDCDQREADRRIAAGLRLLAAAGLRHPRAFAAPQDRFSRESLAAAAREFPVISAGWYEGKRLPLSWLPRYAMKRWSQEPHWRAGNSLLLSHPGCILSRHRPIEGMLGRVRHAIKARPLTVLVTHWWEYFVEGKPDLEFIKVLHATAALLAGDPEVRVISFDDLASGRITIPGVNRPRVRAAPAASSRRPPQFALRVLPPIP